MFFGLSSKQLIGAVVGGVLTWAVLEFAIKPVVSNYQSDGA